MPWFPCAITEKNNVIERNLGFWSSDINVLSGNEVALTTHAILTFRVT